MEPAVLLHATERPAEWDGITMNDWIFPAFLVTGGLSLSFLLRNPSKSATYRRRLYLAL